MSDVRDPGSCAPPATPTTNDSQSIRPDSDTLGAVVGDTRALCQEIVEQSGDCIKVLDEHARLLWMNAFGQRLMDICDFAPLVGRSWLDFWAGDARETAAHALAAARGGRIGRFTGPCATMSGVVKWWNVSITQLPSDGEGRRLVCTSRDVTEIVRMAERQRELADAERTARAEAERARRSSDALLHSVSHDLRAPLNAVLGWSQLLRREPLGQPACEALEGLELATMRQIRLVDQLLDAARRGAESLRLELETIDICAVAGDALRLLRPVSEAKRLRVRFTSAHEHVPVLGDWTQLHRAVCNLVSNAVKFTPHEGSVDIEVVVGGEMVHLRVRDSGPGISPADASRVFDAFWRAASEDSGESGAGLGLAIVRSVVELHGGTVEVDRNAVGCGAQLTVTLPLARSLDGSSPTGPASSAAVGLRDIHVLLVAPEGPARRALAGTLEHAGASIATCATSAEFVDRCRRDAIVIVDDAVGVDALRAVAGHAADLSAPMLVLASSRPSSREPGWTVVDKPVLTRELAAQVRALAPAAF